MFAGTQHRPRAGVEVVQVYAGERTGAGGSFPEQELCGFTKIALALGGRRRTRSRSGSGILAFPARRPRAGLALPAR